MPISQKKDLQFFLKNGEVLENLKSVLDKKKKLENTRLNNPNC